MKQQGNFPKLSFFVQGWSDTRPASLLGKPWTWKNIIYPNMEALSPWFWWKIHFLVKALIITLDQVLTGFLSLTSKLKQGTPIFKESKIFDAYFFLWRVKYATHEVNLQIPYISNNSLLSSLSFIAQHPRIFLPCSLFKARFTVVSTSLICAHFFSLLPHIIPYCLR